MSRVFVLFGLGDILQPGILSFHLYEPLHGTLNSRTITPILRQGRYASESIRGGGRVDDGHDVERLSDERGCGEDG